MRLFVILAALSCSSSAANKTIDWTTSASGALGGGPARGAGSWFSPARSIAPMIPFRRQGPQGEVQENPNPPAITNNDSQAHQVVGPMDDKGGPGQEMPADLVQDQAQIEDRVESPQISSAHKELSVGKSLDPKTIAGGGNTTLTITNPGRIETTTINAPETTSHRPDANGLKDLPNNPSYHMFCTAVDAYSVTRLGGHPPKPDHSVYNWYQRIVAPHMSLAEQAMFLANTVWETAGLQFLEELACLTGNCTYGRYYGRGYIQLTWDYNYRDASRALFGDDRLLIHPEWVAEVEGGWRTALYYWQKHVTPRLLEHDAIARHLFGYSVMAINGAVECTNNSMGLDRLRIYNKILAAWGLTQEMPGKMTGCYQEDARDFKGMIPAKPFEPPRTVKPSTDLGQDGGTIIVENGSKKRPLKASPA